MRFSEAYGGWAKSCSSQIEAANRYLHRRYRRTFNAELAAPATQSDSAYLPWMAAKSRTCCATLYEHFDRTVGRNNSSMVQCWKSPLTANTAITSKRTCARIATAKSNRPHTTARAAWLMMMPKERT